MSQVAAKLSEKKTNVIFAITKPYSEDYRLLKDFLDGAEVGILSNGTDNIVHLIQEQYNVRFFVMTSNYFKES